MAHTITWPGELRSRADKQCREEKRRRASARAKKGPLARAVAAVFGPLAAALERPDTGQYALYKGAAGELAVARELDRLPDGWFIVNDVRVGGSQIDHIVLGPRGISCLETKHSGTVRVDKAGNFYRLERRMWVPANSPAAQNMRHVNSIKGFLGKRFDYRPHINSIVVYIGQGHYELETLTVPPGHTRIAFLNNIRKLLPALPAVPKPTEKPREMALALAGVKRNAKPPE